MKKTLLLLFFLCTAVLSSFAQIGNTPKLSAGFDLGVPVGVASNAYEITGGVSLKLELPVIAPLSITLTTGYTGYVTQGGFSTGYYYSSDGSNSYTNGAVACFIPLEAGARLYVSRKFFIEGDLGASFNINSNYTEFTNKRVALIYAPIAGISIPLGSSKSSIDVSLRYESRVETGYNFSQVAARAAFSFGL
jgi:hypothetical protein